jgi:molybdate transport system substrate-binding protein
MMAKIQAATAVPADSGSWPLSRYWMFSPLQDAAFVLLTPVPILLAFFIARRAGWMDALLTFGLTLAMGHYLPGILRAYGDRALFRRFRTRLIVAPVFLTGVTTWFAYRNLHIIILLAGLWGLWHWMMQSYGFARIYDAKSAAAARTPARLDQLVCGLWFGSAVFVLNTGLAAYLTDFYAGGGPYLQPTAIAWFIRGWFAVTLAVTLVYAIHTGRAIRGGHWPNPLKFLFIAATTVYLAYTVSVVERPKAGLVMFEAWHDVQYLAIVWLFNLNRARKNPEAGPFIRFLFRPRALLVLVYVGICLAFGSLTHAWSLFESAAVVRIAASMVTAVAMLHYYLDGFIWKIRETDTREALNVANLNEAKSVKAGLPSWLPSLRHAALWAMFVVPAVIFSVRELNGSAAPPLAIYEDVATAFPNSVSAHYQLARELQDAGRSREAKAHFELALSGSQDVLPAHIFLGVLLADQKDLAGARRHFEQALRMDPDNAEVHNNLGIVLDDQGNPAAAKIELERALKLAPHYTLAQSNLASVTAKLAAPQDAPVRVLSSNGVKAAVQELHAKGQQTIAHPLAVQFNTTASIKQRIENGEAFEVAILTAEAIDALIKEGKIAAQSRADIGEVGIGVGIRAGAKKPDIGTPDAIKQTLLNARSITYAEDGASRPHIEKMFGELGIAEQMKSRTRLQQGSDASNARVAAGDVELVITLTSEILPATGIELAGPLPEKFQSRVRFAAGVSTNARDIRAANALIKFLTGNGAPTFKAKGIEPAK